MFDTARIKLTAWYLVIIMCISVSFSLVIYQMLNIEVERFAFAQRNRMERRVRREKMYMGLEIDPPPFLILTTEDLELVSEMKDHLVLNLISINAFILVVSGGLSYLLAGKTLKPIQKMVEEQSRFVGDASHELRTPLTSLKTAMEVFLRSKETKISDAKQLVKENILEVNKLQRLAEDLLYLAQNQESQKNMSFTNASVDSLVLDAIGQVKPMADERKINVIYSENKHEICADKKGLIDVLVILLDNAIKYSVGGSTITINTTATRECNVITVSDEGIGIDPKDIPHVFDRFYRADAARSKLGAGGYGLGLSIAKRIIDQHKGKITVDSVMGKGTTFTVRIPKRNVKAQISNDPPSLI